MKRLLTLLLVLFVCGRVVAITINFDVWPNGDPIVLPPYPSKICVPITDEFSGWGIIFDAGTDIMESIDTPSPPNVLAAGLTRDGATLNAHFIQPGNPAMRATVPWAEITQDGGAASGDNVLIAYDLNGNECDRVAFNTPLGTFRVEYAGGIYRIFANGRDSLDDLTFPQPTPIPAPGAVVLASIGVGFVGWLRRRRTL